MGREFGQRYVEEFTPNVTRLVRSAMIVELDPITDCAAGTGEALEPLAVYALLFQ